MTIGTGPAGTQATGAGTAGTAGVPISKVQDATPAVKDMAINWDMITALLGGTATMRLAAEKYMPRWPNEGDTNLRARIYKATLFPAFKRTVETLASRPFAKPITLSDKMPDDVKEYMLDIDLEGRNIDQFAADMMGTTLGYGLGGILVDYQIAQVEGDENPPALSIAAEKAKGLRPYFVSILPTQILGWRASTINGEHVLTMLRYMETINDDDGEFGVKAVPQIRVLEPGRWRIFRKVEQANGSLDWQMVMEGTTTLDFIPFVPIYGERTDFMVGKPPLAELAHLNVKHWQSQSDQDTLMHVARVPILTAIGIEDNPENPFKLVIGASGAVKLPAGAELKYTEHSGAAISAGKTSLDDLKEDMRQSGAELLVMKPGPATATEVASDNAVGMCALQKITLSLQDALNQAIDILGLWLKRAKGTCGTITIFKDFGAATLQEASALLLVGMSNTGKLSTKTLYYELKRRGILGPEVDYDEEMSLIADEGPYLPPGGVFGEPAIPGVKKSAQLMNAPAGAALQNPAGQPKAAPGGNGSTNPNTVVQ